MRLIKFLKEWTLPCAITIGTVVYLLFRYIPALDGAGDRLGPVMDDLLPLMIFLTLFVTFCKVDFRQMRLHRWHAGVMLAQVGLVALFMGAAYLLRDNSQQKVLAEAVLTCVIAPTAAAAPVVSGKLGGNISTMTTLTLVSSLLAAVLIPAAFPLLEKVANLSFWAAFWIILQKMAYIRMQSCQLQMPCMKRLILRRAKKRPLHIPLMLPWSRKSVKKKLRPQGCRKSFLTLSQEWVLI